MATYERCGKAVQDLANQILCEYESHKPLLDARVKIDLVFARTKEDALGMPVGFAIPRRGRQVLGMARKLPPRQRVLGRGDAEILLDWHWWHKNSEPDEQKALLDHELHHFRVDLNPNGTAKVDWATRPKLIMRRHDFEFGWFTMIAARHGASSQEVKQAKAIMDGCGQFYWPGLVK